MRDNSLIQFTLRNLGWMAASIALAMVVWIAATMSNNPIEDREMKDIPITVLLPDGTIITRQPTPLTASVVVRAQKSDWNLLVPADILITADLRDKRQPGEYRIELEARVAAPLHGRVVAIRPSTLTLTIDQVAETRVPVRVIVRREPPLGYSYPSDLACDQTEVTVRGSAEKVQMVEAVEVRMDLSDERNPITRSFDVIPVQDNGRTVTAVEIVPANVSCTVDIQAREDVIQMRVLPDVVGNPPNGYIFEGYVSQPETVGVTGDRGAISDLAGLVRTVPISLSGQTETFTAEVPLALPPGVAIVPENQLIRVTVTISAVRSSVQFQQVPVEITGLDSTAYRATVLPNAVTVLVVGPEAHLPGRDQVRVIVNLGGLVAGNHQVAPEGVLADQNDNDEMTITVRPEQISVTIESLHPTPVPSPTPSAIPSN